MREGARLAELSVRETCFLVIECCLRLEVLVTGTLSKNGCPQEMLAVFSAVSSTYRECMLKVAFEGVEVRLPHLCNGHMAAVTLECSIRYSVSLS